MGELKKLISFISNKGTEIVMRAGRIHACVPATAVAPAHSPRSAWRREDTREYVHVLDESLIREIPSWENCNDGEIKISRVKLAILTLYYDENGLYVEKEPELKTSGLIFGRVLGAKAWEIKLPLRIYVLDEEKMEEKAYDLPTFYFLNPPIVSAKVRYKSGVRTERIFAEWSGEIKVIVGGRVKYRIKVWWIRHEGGRAHDLVIEKIKEKTRLKKELEILKKEHERMGSELASKLERAVKVLDEEIAELRKAKQSNNSKRFARLRWVLYDEFGIVIRQGEIIAPAVHANAIKFGNQIIFIEKGSVKKGDLVEKEWKPFGLRGFFNHIIRIDKIYKSELKEEFKSKEEAKRAAQRAFVRRPIRVRTEIDKKRGVSATIVAPAGAHAAALRIINRDHAREGLDRVYVYLQPKTRLQFLHGL